MSPNDLIFILQGIDLVPREGRVNVIDINGVGRGEREEQKGSRYRGSRNAIACDMAPWGSLNRLDVNTLFSGGLTRLLRSAE